MSKIREVLFLKEVNGVDEWFEDGNEETDAKYIGEIENGVPNGTGTNIWPSGAKYEGNFKDGEYNGQGSYTWSDGRKYEGEHKDGERQGQGTYTFPSGDKYKYIGEWKVQPLRVQRRHISGVRFNHMLCAVGLSLFGFLGERGLYSGELHARNFILHCSDVLYRRGRSEVIPGAAGHCF